jgi:hypothetical protein
MPNQASNDTLLFTKYTNLNTEQCLYAKKPDTILSLFSDPDKFSVSDQILSELNGMCGGCSEIDQTTLGGSS